MRFPLQHMLWIAGVVAGSFAILAQMNVEFGIRLFIIAYGSVGAFALLYFISAFLLQPGHSLTPDSDDEEDASKQEEKVCWANRISFWSNIFKLLVAVVIGYYLLLGIPYVLFGATVGDIKSYFLENPAGQVMMVQLLGQLPMWFILPFFYFFAFYGPFVLKVIILDVKRTPPGSTKFKIKRKDIVGQDEVLEELSNMVGSVIDRSELNKLGIRPERGVLLVGPPGTGKTRTLKYLASTKGLPLIEIKSTISRQTFIGVSVIAMWIAQFLATRMSKKYGGALVLIDEVDLLAQSRSQVETNFLPPWLNRFISHIPFFGGGDDSATVVLMTWMSGMEGGSPFWYSFIRGNANTLIDASFADVILVPACNVLALWPMRAIFKRQTPYLKRLPRLPAWQVSGDDGCYFVGTTNRPQTLDPAITRNERFSPVLLYYDLPDEEGRIAFVNYDLPRYPHESELDVLERRRDIARFTEGLSQANMGFVFNNAYLRKVHRTRRENRTIPLKEIKMSMEDIIESRDMLYHGIAKLPRASLLGQRRKVAVHEGGHLVLTGYVSDDMIPFHLSAKRRGKSYGRVESLPVVPVDIHSQRFFTERLRVALASYATERVIFGETTQGVAGDLAVATLIACQMTELLGMGPYACSDKDRKRYQKVGQKLASWHHFVSIVSHYHLEYSPLVRESFGEESFLNPAFLSDFAESAMKNHHEEVEVLLGQAYVLDHLFVERNQEIIKDIAKRLEDAGWEIRGEPLRQLYQELRGKIQPVEAPPSREEEWPRLETSDPFYRRDET